jgi:hypothetical protein
MAVLLVVTIISVVVACAATYVALRLVREERARSEARVAALAGTIHAQPSEIAFENSMASKSRPQFATRAEATRRFPAVAAHATPDLPLRDVPLSTTPLFAVAPGETSARRLIAVVALGVFIVAAAAGLAIVFSGETRAMTARSVRGSSESTQRAVNAISLELTALSQDRSGDQLTVRGVVRNPGQSAALTDLTAVVLAFDRDGGFVASGRGAAEDRTILPGHESSFVVTVPNAGEVGRYRVSFRIGDRVVAHVDRRERDDAVQSR